MLLKSSFGQLLTLLVLSCVFLRSEGTTCTSIVESLIDRLGGCDSVTCHTGLSQKTCEDIGAVLEEGAAMCGCCPGCVKYQLKYLEECDKCDEKYDYDPACTDQLICPILKCCPRGLECFHTGFKEMCVPMPKKPDCTNKCFVKRSLIEYENELYQPPQLRNLPSCNEDGTFAPVQCKGTKSEGDCYCVDECGKRTFGRALYENAANMTCGCSTLVHNLRKKGQIATIHCTEDGDFEPLQCDTDSGLCYCVDEKTGKTTGEVLPENQFRLLPCFNASDENFSSGANYLRVCESEWAAAQKVTIEGAIHGLKYTHTALQCDFDGGYAPVYWDMVDTVGQDRCVHRSGDTLGNYFRSHAEAPVMDCNCARDSVFRVPFRGTCQQENRPTSTTVFQEAAPGSYKPYESDQTNAWCVDLDGYPYGPTIPKELICCLEGSQTCDDADWCEADPDQNRPYKILDCSRYELGRHY